MAVRAVRLIGHLAPKRSCYQLAQSPVTGSNLYQAAHLPCLVIDRYHPYPKLLQVKDSNKFKTVSYVCLTT